MSHHEMGCQALRQSPLAPAPWLNLKAKFDCWHLLPWEPRLGWVLGPSPLIGAKGSGSETFHPGGMPTPASPYGLLPLPRSPYPGAQT